MSASERLREISRLAPATHWKPRDVLFDALPELIAVVEAVEKALDQDYGDGPPTMEIGASLAALDAKLSVT